MLYHTSTNNLLLCLLATLSYSGAVSAVNFELTKSLEFGATTTDNIALTDIDSDKVSELVFNITPSVQLKYSGNRFGVAALAKLDYLRFNSTEGYIVDPSLFVTARGTVVDGLLFIDSKLAVTKLDADSSFVRPTDIGETAATVDTNIYIDKRYGEFANLYLGYSFNTVLDRTDNDSPLSAQGLDFSFKRNPRNGGLIWGVGASYDLDNSGSDELENSYVYGTLGASVNRDLLVELTYGLESRSLLNGTDTATATLTEYENTPLWKIGANFSPSEHTTLQVGYGKRFFGSGPSMSLEHRIQNSTLTASYTRDISRETASLDGISTLDATNTDQTIGNTGAVTVDGTNNLNLLNEPFVDNQFKLGYKLVGRRSDIVLDLVLSNQEQLTGEDTIESLLVRLAFDRQMSEFFTLRLQYDYQSSEASTLRELNYDENRFAVKFIYSPDGRPDSSSDSSSDSNSEFDESEIDLE